MRSFLAGLLILALTSAATGQVRGEVESIGFGSGWYRPQCWTPMVVRLQSQISEPAEYRIEVHQHDLDFDHVIYVKDGITLNGQAVQRWEICFLPEPVHNGLAGATSLRELQDKLRVYLTNKDGTKQILQLPITSPVESLEAHFNTGYAEAKARRLALVVMDGSSRPALSEAAYDKAIGLTEIPTPVAIRPSGLPQSALAYDAVDTVIWISGDAHALSEQGSKQLTALEQWVRQGGTLVVCQPGRDADRLRIEPFADLLPVEWKENGEWKVNIREKDNLEPLVSLAAKKHGIWGRNFWNMQGKFPFAKATARPNAVVLGTDWIAWDAAGKDQTPYIARIPCGLGCVTWVAQDLGDPTLTGPNTAGWPYVWEHVLGRGDSLRVANDQSEFEQTAYSDNGYSDVGAAQLAGVEFGAKGFGLIALAIFFFIIYWIVAGPGSYLFLAGKKRKDLSWAAFGLAAVGATLLTVLVVRLVLRGSPEIRHATDIRIVSGQEPQPAIEFSRIGLYIPRDGDQHLALADTSNRFPSYITPIAIPPTNNDNEYPANLDYHVPVRDEGSTDPVAIDVPFRSTLKKLDAQWSGDTSRSIRATGVQLVPNASSKNMIRGTLDNLTGTDLTHVYIAFRRGDGQDFVIYVPYWAATGSDSRLDLNKLLLEGQLPLLGTGTGISPDNDKPCWGNINQQWAPYWFRLIRPSQTSASEISDLHAHVPNSFPVVSLYGLLPPPKGDKGNGIDSFTVLRRGARNWDVSQAVLAGELVVLGQADNQPLPFPLEVNGGKVGGDGTVFYQFALPLDHAGEFKPPVQ